MRTIICAAAFLAAGGSCGAGVWTQPEKKVETKPDADRVKGMKAAVADIEKGTLKLFLPPAPAPLWHHEYVALLRKECGVEATVIGFTPAEGGDKATAGYNDVMRVEIEHRFGERILDRLQARAEKLANKIEEKGKKGDGPPTGVNVFAHPEKLTAADKLSDGSGAPAIEIKGETTLVWVDLSPFARFGHPTKYILISKDGVKVVDGTWWPVLNGKNLFRDGKTAAIEFPIKTSGK